MNTNTLQVFQPLANLVWLWTAYVKPINRYRNERRFFTLNCCERKTTGINRRKYRTEGISQQKEVNLHYGKESNKTDVLLNFERITKLDYYKTILVGTVTFNHTQISGDGIIVDFVHRCVQYHKKGDRYAYELEIDSRCKDLWDGLLGQIKMALDSQNRPRPKK